MEWTRAADVVAHGSRHPAWMHDLVGWILNFVAQPKPDLGRSGDVCPFVRSALEKNLIFLAGSALDGSEMPKLLEEMAVLRPDFFELAEGVAEQDRVYQSLLYAFPQIPQSRAGVLMEVRKAVKPAFIQAGLTCGEFYVNSEDRSIRNACIRIASSPVPCIAFRHLTPHDKLFLESQPELYAIYERWLQRAR